MTWDKESQSFQTRQVVPSIRSVNYLQQDLLSDWVKFEYASHGGLDGLLNVTYLAFVRAIVTFLNVFDLQIPVVSSLCVHNLKSLVVSVGEEAWC